MSRRGVLVAAAIGAAGISRRLWPGSAGDGAVVISCDTVTEACLVAPPSTPTTSTPPTPSPVGVAATVAVPAQPTFAG